MKKHKIKNISLSIVALVLILLLTVGVTYGWIDDVKLVEFQNDDLVLNGAPLKTGVDINSDIKITKDNNTINLGSILEDSDLLYTYTEDGKHKKHTKYDGGANEPDWDHINENKGYFYESGDMHLSGCYSDGETFYFPRQGQSGYREGNKDDENVNYISFTTRVSSPYANVDFWFDGVPTVKQHGTDTTIDNARYAITVDGKSHVYSSSGTANTCNSGLTGTTGVSGVRKTSTYTYNNNDNTTTDRGKNSNTVFSIKKGDTVILNIKIWLEAGYSTSITASDINLTLISSWAFTRTIKVVDRTTTNTKRSWLNDNSATMFLTCPYVLEEMCEEKYSDQTVVDWSAIKSQSGYSHAPFYQLSNPTTSTIDGVSVKTYTVSNVPLVFNGEEMIIYRCSSSGWNNGSHSGKTGDHGVTYWNWWKSNLPNTYKTATYTLYGGSHDEYAGYVVGSTEDTKYRTYLGYGTWGSVDNIKVDPKYHDVNWAEYNATSDNVYIRDYSDESTSGETYIHSMYWDSSAQKWTACIPTSSTLIKFMYTQDSVIKGVWGYKSYGDDNPQQRPEGDTTYHFAFKNDKSNNVDGMGYWSTNDYVYFIANYSTFQNKNSMKSYLFYKYKHWENNNASDVTVKNADFPGTDMTKLTEKYQNTYNVWRSTKIGPNNSNMYPDRRKSNDGDNAYKITLDTNVVFSSTDQVKDLLIYPGCYYDVANDDWIGSLSGSARSGAGTTSGDAGGDDPGGTVAGATEITTVEPTSSGVYAYGKLSGGSSDVEYAKFSSTSNGGYITMNLTQGTTYKIMLRKGKKSSGWSEYSASGSVTLSNSTNGDQNYKMNTNGGGGKLTLNVSNTGTYKIMLDSVTENSIRLVFYKI